VHTNIFLWPFGLRGKVAKLYWLLLPSWGTLSHSMVKSVGGKYHGSRDLRTSNGGSSLCGDEKLA
jgi:hypothetical protein